MSGMPTMHDYACNGKQQFLPPRSPVPSMEPFGVPISSLRHDLGPHHRTSSGSMIVEEQPSWVDDLLNEPETPIRRGAHRRCSSDSFAYLDAHNISSNLHIPASLECNRSSMPPPSWGIPKFDNRQDVHSASYYNGRPQSRAWEAYSSSSGYQIPNNAPFNKNSCRSMGLLRYTSEANRTTTSSSKKQNQDVSASQTDVSPEMSGDPHRNNPQPDAEQKRIKQHFAQRSRVRKLQYIADLERNVKALQAEGSEVSSELQFLEQQNIILSMENETLRRRLASLSQEHLLKQFQHEMLESEIARLRSFLIQQQQHQLPVYSHSRSSSRDLDSQFASLSMEHKETKSTRETVSAPLRI